MSSNAKSWLLASAVVAGLGASGAARAQDAASAEGRGCPVTHQALTQALRAAVDEVGSNDMWASVVNRDGVVCAVTFSGPNRAAQFAVSRVISAAKAFTANGVSLNGAPLSTAQLYPLTQPRGSLFGLEAGNPVDTDAAYQGPVSRFGTPQDPMVGDVIGGTITFGGGVALARGATIVGGVGVSGDTACADDEVVRDLRRRLRLVPSASDAASFGSGSNQHPAC